MSHPLPAPVRYHGFAIALHWLLALALTALFLLGVYMHELPFSPRRLQLYSWHKWAGLVVLCLSVLRLAWRWWHPPPALPVAMTRAMPAWQQCLHHATHHGLYLLFFAVPLLGWAYSSAAGFSVVWFGVWLLPDWVPVDPQWAEWLKLGHRWANFALLGLVGLHVAAALKHACWDRDGLLLRMLWRRSTQTLD